MLNLYEAATPPNSTTDGSGTLTIGTIFTTRLDLHELKHEMDDGSYWERFPMNVHPPRTRSDHQNQCECMDERGLGGRGSQSTVRTARQSGNDIEMEDL